MKKIIFFLYLLFPLALWSQDLGIVNGLDSRHFQLKKSKDTIDFILVNGRIDTIKPVLIFCQGSTPVPLVIQFPDGEKTVSVLSFNYRELAKNYHLVVISMPKTPFEAKTEHLNKLNMYVTDTANLDSIDPRYLAANYLENYVSRAKAIVNFLYKQKWVNKRRIILLGHSQGAKVSIEAAVNNRKVYKLGFLSGNPFGRLDQYIRLERYLSIIGKKQPGESQAMINQYYEVWKDVVKNPKRKEVLHGDPNLMWKSFSSSQLEDLLKIKTPIYVAYGTEDFKAVMCDMLPLHFISAGKTNLTLKPYVGLEHNFMEIDKNRDPIYETMHWQDVMDDFIKWVETTL